MVSHMKTTIDVADGLLAAAKAQAAEEHTTLRALVEEGLRAALDRRTAGRSYGFEPIVHGGEGLQPGIDLGDWEQIRSIAYEGHGG